MARSRRGSKKLPPPREEHEAECRFMGEATEAARGTVDREPWTRWARDPSVVAFERAEALRRLQDAESARVRAQAEIHNGSARAEAVAEDRAERSASRELRNERRNKRS